MAKKKKSSGEPTKEIPFEQSLEQLQRVVQQLEDGGLGLSDALTLYEKGVTHLKRCYQALEKAERKIELLAGVDADGQPITEPYDDQDLSLKEKHEARPRRRSKTSTGARSSSPRPNDLGVDEPPGLF